MTVTQLRAQANCLFTVAVALLAADWSLPFTKLSGQVAPSQVERLAAGDSHSCAIIAAQLYCWGSNDFGQLGDRSTATLRPEMVKRAAVRVSVVSQAVSDVAPGHSHTCAVVVGEVICWGSNQFGQSGASSEFPGAAPTTVRGLGERPLRLRLPTTTRVPWSKAPPNAGEVVALARNRE